MFSIVPTALPIPGNCYYHRAHLPLHTQPVAAATVHPVSVGFPGSRTIGVRKEGASAIDNNAVGYTFDVTVNGIFYYFVSLDKHKD